MSFRWTRTAKVSKSRIPQAIGWGKEVSAFAQKKFGTPEIRMYMNAFGDVGVLRWEIDYADLAAFEAVQSKLMMDQEYWQYIAKADQAEIFVDGSVHDEISKLL